MATVTHKMLADARSAVKSTLGSYKKNIEAAMPKYKKACESLAAKIRDYNARKKDFDKNDTAKNGERLDEAITAVKEAYASYSDIRASVADIHSTVLGDFAELVALSEQVSLSEGDRSRTERENYIKYYRDLLSKNSKALDPLTVPDFLSTPADGDEEGEEDESVEEPEVACENEPAPRVAAPTAGVTSVNIAPITIDVSGIVERAISATIDKLNAGMERKISEYLAGLTLPAPQVNTQPTQKTKDASGVIDAIDTVMGYEEQIIGRIRGICDTLSSIIDGLVALTTTAGELSDKQQQLAALQRQINELQRQTARDQQGVVVNQRLISEEQKAVSAETASQLDSLRTTKK
ncbi:MAG: hypothetical protein IJY24_05120 [Clostridia bacterium]|nr:hypothetical protein [Clostridia bacterium]